MDSTLNSEGAFNPQGIDFSEESINAKEAVKLADDDEGYSPTIERGRE